MKSRTKPALRVVPAAQVQLSLNVQGVLRDVQQATYGLCVNAGKQVLAAMMETDRVALCGAQNVPQVGRKAVRVGTTRSSVVLGGQRIAVTKPRAHRRPAESGHPHDGSHADEHGRLRVGGARLGLGLRLAHQAAPGLRLRRTLGAAGELASDDFGQKNVGCPS
jgi:hypothetical protein